MKIEIDDKLIKEAESIFIGGNPFDKERINFIKKLDTCDLLAVPGSGKTTALIAKLYCLAQKMPFEDGAGILVLAHTNHAVDEIENKLKKNCPHLFEYPNFVGTIQSFINRFLTIPLYNQKNNNKFKIIEYEDYIKEFDYHLAHTKEAVAYFKNNNPSIYYSANLNINLHGTIYVCTENKDEEINLKCPQKWIKENTSETKIEEVKKFIKETKIKIFQKGYLNYSDCYFYAKKNIFENLILKEILQKRFKYVFIDEMQDLEEFQINIIDNIFFSETSKTVIQRIGDVNQSIYSSGKKIKVECDWKPRKIEYLKSSYRLTEEIANLVNGFTLDPQKDENKNPRFVVKGLNKLEKNIKPHLILFNKETTGEQLQRKFEDLIKANNLLDCGENIRNGFKIIGWTTVWDKDEQKQDKEGNNKIRLKDLFKTYTKEGKAKKEDFDCLKKHLQLFNQEKQTLEAVRKSILNSFIRILRFEDIYFDLETKKHFRKSTLIVFIKNQGEDVYNNFKANLFDWCFCLVTKNDYENIYQKINEYISNTFIKWNWYNEESYIPKTINKSIDFICSKDYQFTEINNTESAKKEELKNGINIEISSVHSVKGQTHCATMYIESAYKTPVYETKKLMSQTTMNPLFFQNHDCNKPTGKEAIKMMYVGFSRPTHLLCFAVLDENVLKEKEKFEKAGWNWDNDLIR
ncbi:UvrD-helicase domain-containing protein [Flavobacterium sp.]|uniref:UvrD-helicase domain-containing protein n=1 Tax=Flavobacterium sp. TaxID=239 RepID=UPI00286DBB27|nr:UvrD-helicase domain-containing protein [Flavobacterium sp.]